MASALEKLKIANEKIALLKREQEGLAGGPGGDGSRHSIFAFKSALEIKGLRKEESQSKHCPWGLLMQQSTLSNNLFFPNFLMPELKKKKKKKKARKKKVVVVDLGPKELTPAEMLEMKIKMQSVQQTMS